MKSLLSFIVLIFALVALSGPSLGMGLGLHGVPHGGEVVVTSDGGSALIWTCKGLGGKRLLPCHPDLGVLTETPDDHVPALAARAVVIAALLERGQVPSAELPPPRLG